jgi:hypothetical protein
VERRIGRNGAALWRANQGRIDRCARDRGLTRLAHSSHPTGSSFRRTVPAARRPLPSNFDSPSTTAAACRLRLGSRSCPRFWTNSFDPARRACLAASKRIASGFLDKSPRRGPSFTIGAKKSGFRRTFSFSPKKNSITAAIGASLLRPSSTRSPTRTCGPRPRTRVTRPPFATASSG